MPKVTDLKGYYADIAKKAGLKDKELEQVLAAMDNEAFTKAFSEGFKPLPDYSHDLDDVRNRTKSEIEAAKKAELETYYAAEKTKFDNNMKVWNEAQARIRQYEATYGPIDGGTPMDPNAPTAGLTADEVKKLMEAQLNEVMGRRDRATLDLLDVREDHITRFKKSLNTESFEKAWKDHPEWGGSLKHAYKEFISEDIEKARESDVEARIKAAREEGMRDGFSRKSMPADSGPSTFSPMFDRDTDVGKLSESEQERQSAQAFFDGLHEPAKTGA